MGCWFGSKRGSCFNALNLALHFHLEDLRHLKRKRRVDWIVLERGTRWPPQVIAALAGPYSDEVVMTCRIL
jgi:hypothetical protein